MSSVRAIEAEVSIKSGIEAECTIGREVVVEIHDDVNLETLTATENGSYRPESGVDGWDRVTVSVPERVPVTDSLSVTENGTYEPSEGVDGYDRVSVSVPERVPVTESLTATSNGTYEPGSGVDGYDQVTVNVPERQPDIESLTATSNGTYTSGKDGYNPVVVEVPPTVPDIEPLTVTENGTYTASGDGYNPVTVNVPERQPITESLLVTENGTYTPSAGIDGFSSVTVDVPSSAPTPTQPTLTLVGQSTHTLTEYTNTSTAETIDTGIDVTGDNHSFLLVIITCNDGTPAVENAWGGIYMDVTARYTATGRIYPSTAGVYEAGTKSLLMSEASSFGIGNNTGPIHLVSNVPTVRFIRRALSNGRTVMAGTYTVKVYGIDSL